MGDRRARTALAERPARVEAVATDEAEATVEAADEPVSGSGEAQAVEAHARVGYAPIVRVDATRREIELCATSEAVDSYGTVFDYEASKDAFSRWIGNVREMHERRAVGQRVAIRCDDENRRVHVIVRVSSGARDTWEKVLDGTLRGASIGASNVVWQKQTRVIGGQPRAVTVATKYDLVELSLVDNPSNPDALGIAIVRDATPDVTLLDPLGAESAPAPLPQEPASQQRARGPFSPNAEGYPDAGVPDREEGRPISALGATPEGNARQRLHTAARSVLAACECPRCAGALAALGRPEDEAAGDDASGEARRSASGQEAAATQRDAALARALSGGLSASVTRLDRMDETVRGLKTLVQAGINQMASTVGDLRIRIEDLEAQPLPGGPVARPTDKTHALAQRAYGAIEQTAASEHYRALESLAGRLTDPQAQIAVAAELIRLRQQGM